MEANHVWQSFNIQNDFFFLFCMELSIYICQINTKNCEKGLFTVVGWVITNRCGCRWEALMSRYLWTAVRCLRRICTPQSHPEATWKTCSYRGPQGPPTLLLAPAFLRAALGRTPPAPGWPAGAVPWPVGAKGPVCTQGRGSLWGGSAEKEAGGSGLAGWPSLQEWFGENSSFSFVFPRRTGELL